MKDQIRIIKVSPVISYVPYNPYLNETVTNYANDKEFKRSNDAKEEIKEEKISKEIEKKGRYKVYRDILLNESQQQTPYRYGLYGTIASILLGVGLTSILTIIPVHDVLDKSQDMSRYWYEVTIQAVTGFLPACCAYMMLNCSYWMNIRLIKSWKHFSIFYVQCFAFGATLGITIHLVWIYGLGLRFPAPFFGMVWAYIMIYFAFIPLWYRFPSHWRKQQEIFKKFKFFVLAISVNLLITIIYTFYTKIFLVVSRKYQWGYAIFLIPLREFNIWLQTKVAFKTAGVKDTSVSITSGHNINNRHCFFLAVVLGTIATDTTCWVILAIDLGINLYLCMRIVFTKTLKGIKANNEAHMIDLFLSLVINQTVEIVVPLTYFLCFLMAFYGPNAKMLGSVQSDYYAHIPVQDIGRFIQNLGFFLMADAISIVITFSLLWHYCSVNIIRAFAFIQKEFWLLMAVNTAYTVNVVSLSKSKIRL